MTDALYYLATEVLPALVGGAVAGAVVVGGLCLLRRP